MANVLMLEAQKLPLVFTLACENDYNWKAGRCSSDIWQSKSFSNFLEDVLSTLSRKRFFWPG